jgi:hypothetical protein
MFVVAERFLSNIVSEYGLHLVFTDGGTWYPPQACSFLKLDHYLHSSFKKSIIERTIQQYIKDRTETFDDYFPCKKNKCKLNHVKQWLNLLLINTIKKYYLKLTVPNFDIYLIMYLIYNKQIIQNTLIGKCERSNYNQYF